MPETKKPEEKKTVKPEPVVEAATAEEIDAAQGLPDRGVTSDHSTSPAPTPLKPETQSVLRDEKPAKK